MSLPAEQAARLMHKLDPDERERLIRLAGPKVIDRRPRREEEWR